MKNFFLVCILWQRTSQLAVYCQKQKAMNAATINDETGSQQNMTNIKLGNKNLRKYGKLVKSRKILY